MENSHRSILRANRMALCQAMDSNVFIDQLIISKILTKSDQYNLLIERSNLKKNEKLLDILTKRGPKAFPAFVEILESSKLSHLIGLEEKGSNKSSDSGNQTMNEEKSSHSLIDVKKGEKFVFDTTGDRGSFEEEEDTNPNEFHPEGKVPKVDDPIVVVYDTTDTPDYSTHRNGKSKDGNLIKSSTHHYSNEVSADISVKMEAANHPAGDSTDAPPCASPADPEDEDGPFSRLGSHRSKGTDAPMKTVADHSPSEFEPINCYPMKTLPRGYFLIINNKDFLPASTMQDYPRNGTDVDAIAIQNLFEELGYVVESHRNLTKYEMHDVCRKAAESDYSSYSAFACCILSHGKEGVIYGTNGEVKIKELTGYFREQNLAGKPKFFIFQACQGSQYMDSVEPDNGLSEIDAPPKEYGNDISLPTEADFIYAYSTVPGYYSWRNSVRGSWFIQGIVEVFRQYAHKMDVIRMLTRVNQLVATKKSATGQRMSHHKRQISSIITQLRYEFYLCPPHGPLKSVRSTAF